MKNSSSNHFTKQQGLFDERTLLLRKKIGREIAQIAQWQIQVARLTIFVTQMNRSFCPIPSHFVDL